MALTIRPYCDTDREGFGEIRSSTYRGGDPVLPEERLLREDCTAYVAERQGVLLGSSTVLDMTCTREQSTLRCAGIAGVAVRPEHRKSGVGTELMVGILPMLREQGFAVASLYPFRESYYRRFGYETCGIRYKVSVPEHRMPSISPELPVSPIDATDFRLLQPCLDSFGRLYSGVNLRNPVQWWRTLGGDRPLMVYAAGDPVEAYAVLRLNPDFWVLQEVKEFIWSTRRGYEAILSLFSSLSINKTEIDWFEPGDSPYLAKYFDKGAQLLVDRQIMFRVLDVPEALSLLSATSHGEFTLEVADEELPENRGPWRIAFSPDGVNVEKASDAELQMDIRHFSQALLGEPSFAQLARQGLVDVAGLSSVEAASRLLPAQPVYCPDFF